VLTKAPHHAAESAAALEAVKGTDGMVGPRAVREKFWEIVQSNPRLLVFGPHNHRRPELLCRLPNRITEIVAKKDIVTLRGSPWENGYIESFNARLRDELLNGEIFYTLGEAQIVIESWRRHYNTIRPHASIGYKPPAPEVFVPAFAAWPAALRRPAPPATLAQRPTLN
jgi:hypothetical protein